MSLLFRKVSSTRLPRIHSLPGCRLLQNPSVGFCLIDQLPSELILEVASWLIVSSAATLALCNTWLFTLLRKSSLDLLNGHDVNHLERTSFVKALGRDNVHTFFCYSCRELHYLRQDHQRKKIAERRFARTSTSLCKTGESMDKYQDEGRRSHSENFTHKHLQVALKLSRHRLYSEAKLYLKSASITRPKAGWINSSGSSWGFELFDALLLNGRICTRGQSWILSPQTGRQALPTSIYDIKICEHFDSEVCGNDSLSDLLQCRILNMCAGERSCVYCQDITCCGACYTDVHVATKTIDADPEVQAVVTTKWQYLEDNMSSISVETRKQYYYKQYRQQPDASFVWPRNMVELTPWTAVPGSVRNVFKQRAATSFDSILSVEEAWKAITGHYEARASLAAQRLHHFCGGISPSRLC